LSPLLSSHQKSKKKKKRKEKKRNRSFISLLSPPSLPNTYSSKIAPQSSARDGTQSSFLISIIYNKRHLLNFDHDDDDDELSPDSGNGAVGSLACRWLWP